MKKILFICYGNVGRSQMAEAFYNDLTHSNDAWSAGIQKNTPKKYGHPPKKVVEAIKKYNIDISKAQVKTLNKKIVENSKRIIIMCKKEQCPEYLFTSNNYIFWKNIEDPYKMNESETKRVCDKIKRRVLSLIK